VVLFLINEEECPAEEKPGERFGKESARDSPSWDE